MSGGGVPKNLKLTTIVPAFNEADCISETIISLKNQSRPPDDIIVVDDSSTDGTGEIARSLGVKVVRPRRNTGSKAGAQNFGLRYVTTDLTMVLDADTTVARNGIAEILKAFALPNTAAACCYVLPRRVRTLWERGRYIEYLYSFSFYKQVQDYFGKPLISSGCLSIYDTKRLRLAGGWSTRTMAEDMDLTWTFYQMGYKVRFVPSALCYPIEPYNFDLMHKQLKRWSAAFLQNVKLHGRGLLDTPFLFTAMAVSLTDATLGALVYLLALPLMAVFVSPWFLLGYIIDAPIIVVPVLIVARRRKEVGKAIASFPSVFILRFVNGFIFLKAVWFEFIIYRPLTTYEKGH